MDTQYAETARRATLPSLAQGCVRARLPCQVLLLVTVTGLFMAAWSADQADSTGREGVAVAQRDVRREGVSSRSPLDEPFLPTFARPIVSDEDVPTSPSERSADLQPTTRTASRDEVSVVSVSQSRPHDALGGEILENDLGMFEGCSLDLPHDIAAGEYRLVNNTGLVKSSQFESLSTTSSTMDCPSTPRPATSTHLSRAISGGTSSTSIPERVPRQRRWWRKGPSRQRRRAGSFSVKRSNRF